MINDIDSLVDDIRSNSVYRSQLNKAYRIIRMRIEARKLKNLTALSMTQLNIPACQQ
jgi:predicted RNA-binding protein associated with RNAse of E/G family